jgi:protein-S-isoprenylcysteine O-methyltransferase
MIAGLLLRVWATQVLGASYTRTLTVDTGQRVIQRGPYRFVRHPGYTGTLLVWLSAPLALANWAVAPIVAIPLLRAYRDRMRTEEEMLRGAFDGEYEAYMRRTGRLVPFVY